MDNSSCYSDAASTINSPEFSEFCQSHARTGHTWLGGPTLGGDAVRPKTAGNLSEARPQSPLTLMNPRTRSTHFLVSRDRMTTNISSGMDMMRLPCADPAASVAASIIETVDVDGDGELDLFEVTKTLMSRPHLLRAVGLSAMSRETQIMAAFQIADVDNSGKITPDELITLLQRRAAGLASLEGTSGTSIFGRGMTGGTAVSGRAGIEALAARPKTPQPAATFPRSDFPKAFFASTNKGESADGKRNVDHYYRVTRDKPGHATWSPHRNSKTAARGQAFFQRGDQATVQDTYGMRSLTHGKTGRLPL
jgi:hypothetical protein